jgi:hypothetical protein
MVVGSRVGLAQGTFFNNFVAATSYSGFKAYKTKKNKMMRLKYEKDYFAMTTPC